MAQRKQDPAHRAGPVVTYRLPGARVRPGAKAQQVPLFIRAALGDPRQMLDPAALAGRAQQDQGPEIGGEGRGAGGRDRRPRGGFGGAARMVAAPPRGRVGGGAKWPRLRRRWSRRDARRYPYLFGELRWDRYAGWVDGTPVASAYHS